MSPPVRNSDVSVVIPVLNAGRFLPALLEALRRQKPFAPREVILVDSQSTDNTREIAGGYPEVRLIPISDFSHGRARNLGAQAAAGEVVVLLTQDALPQADAWLARLLEPFADPKVAAACSRQVPRPDANPMERYFLFTHFPPGPLRRREKRDGEEVDFQGAFFSNVSAAVRKSLLLQFPFDESLIMSEDQQLSRDLLNAGYAVVYAPESVVVHSHNYSLKVCFRRYFDSVYSLTVIYPKHGMRTSASMGFRYLFQEAAYVARNHPLSIPYYFLYTLAKTTGTLAGHFAHRMPNWLLRRLSLHAYHWRDRESKQAPPPCGGPWRS
jgi:rhamnosyltransferase